MDRNKLQEAFALAHKLGQAEDTPQDHRRHYREIASLLWEASGETAASRFHPLGTFIGSCANNEAHPGYQHSYQNGSCTLRGCRARIEDDPAAHVDTARALIAEMEQSGADARAGLIPHDPQDDEPETAMGDERLTELGRSLARTDYEYPILA